MLGLGIKGLCASLLNLTHEIVDRLFNAYQRDLQRKVDFVDGVERWKIRCALVDDKPERLLDTLHATNRDLFKAIYDIISILLTMPVPLGLEDLQGLDKMQINTVLVAYYSL
jgi:hypothetical protein